MIKVEDAISNLKYQILRFEEGTEPYLALQMAIKALEERKRSEETSQSTKKTWTAEEIQKAADLLKERFLQNADYLFCSPEDEADIKKKVGDRFKVKGMAGIEPGKIYLVDRAAVEEWRPGLCSEQEEET